LGLKSGDVGDATGGKQKAPLPVWKQGGGKSLDLGGYQASGPVLLRSGAGLPAKVMASYGFRHLAWT
jgi:hypothetical protein